mmetsp:Transcript_132974/g.413455  ORF Transcript_132974/g.413455 Transcript_132974/m.413455 type:complete len:231 (-) Transcript_132974:174-866(-)|eukprot:CAMPEP_0204603368 /NCGR_PEP_ID=MMETSP0661-20131031/57221_1 /ASSEMBLY_ACC=CAM_ASM_000606 /TAXON_ID=109239 /ORGANISM="Alexandrium margalefi, Strain AMGDE01CS-322" /LENGTH=230 /DNA_ID=CAMNT_0051614423 /DNA_START=78 /DNA_END=770 /DNA_ORIENTATION=-
MPRSAFAELCEQRSVCPEEWERNLSCPLIAKKCLLDMTDEELEDHYTYVEERAENTQEDRALLILQRAQDGRLERQAMKVFQANANARGNIEAEQAPDMLEGLRFELSNIEVHFLLRKFGCTEDFDMIPEALLTQRQWLWLVGECQMLKNAYQHINPEAFEICYETMIQNLKLQKESQMDGTDEWPHTVQGGPDWFKTKGKSSPWNLQPEMEKVLMAQMSAEESRKGRGP